MLQLVGAMVLFIGAITLLWSIARLNSNFVKIDDTTLIIEVADSPDQRARGLMGRLRLAKNHGMLFVFEDSQPRNFWNQDTLIPLDVVFIDGDRVVDVKQLPKFDAAAGPVTVTSTQPARHVVELNQGSAVQVGDPIEITIKR